MDVIPRFSARRLTAALALAGAVFCVPAPAQAAQRFVTPTGVSTGTCDAGAPCQFKYAVETAAQASDEVIVRGDLGDYSITSTVFSTKALDIHGADGQPRPRLVGALGSTMLQMSGPAGAKLHRLQLENANTVLNLVPPSTAGTSVAEDLVVRQTGDQIGTISAVGISGWTLRNSLVTAADPGGFAVQASSGTSELVNLTAVATGTGSSAISMASPGPATATFNVTNTIARGNASDLSAGPSSVINVSFSNFRSGMVATSSGGVVNQQAGNQTSVDPLFANQAGGDYHQAAGSATIDAGTTGALVAGTDFDGEARTQGAAPDIGADEFTVAAPGPGPGDGGGGTGTGGGTGGVADTTAATMTAYAINPTAILPMLSGPSARAVARRRGAIVSYRLSEAATVTFAIERKRSGRRVGRRCVRPTRANRRRPRCTRFVRVASFIRQGVAGTNRFRFTGRARGRMLPRGRYRLRATTKDAAGNVSRPLSRAFTIVR